MPGHEGDVPNAGCTMIPNPLQSTPIWAKYWNTAEFHVQIYIYIYIYIYTSIYTRETPKFRKFGGPNLIQNPYKIDPGRGFTGIWARGKLNKECTQLLPQGHCWNAWCGEGFQRISCISGVYENRRLKKLFFFVVYIWQSIKGKSKLWVIESFHVFVKKLVMTGKLQYFFDFLGWYPIFNFPVYLY